MDILSALDALGADTQIVSEQEKVQLDTEGFLCIENVLSCTVLEALRRDMAALLLREGDTAGQEVHQEFGSQRLSNLIEKSVASRICVRHPKVLAAISYVLSGDLKLSSLNYRSALPGYGLQSLHCDWPCAVVHGDYRVCNSIWLLDDFTPENGATRAVPGTHRSGSMPHEVMENPMGNHKDQVHLLGRAGSVFVFNSHVWHGGTNNQTGEPRRALHSYFCRRSEVQQLSQQAFLSPGTVEDLSDIDRVILDVTL